MVMMVTVALMMVEMGARWLSELELYGSIERSWVRNPSGGFRRLVKFVYHMLPKGSRGASIKSEKDRSRSLNQRRKEAL